MLKVIIYLVTLLLLAPPAYTNSLLHSYNGELIILNDIDFYHEFTPDLIDSKFCRTKFSIRTHHYSRINIERTLIYEKQHISYRELYSLTERIITDLPEIKEKPDLIRLVVETAITETDGGMYYDTTNQGGLGLTQINYKTAKELLSDIKKDKSHIANALEKYKHDNLSLRENLIHNMAFNLALCATYYYYNEGDSLYKRIKTLDKRAILWKQIYNTPKGKGTPEIYKKRVVNYNH